MSVSVSLSRNASTKACTPDPVIKLDSKFKLRNVLFTRSISLNAWEEEEEIKYVNIELSGVNKSIKSPHSTTSHHSYWVITPCCREAELLDVCVLLHGFGEVLQCGNWNILKTNNDKLPLVEG